MAGRSGKKWKEVWRKLDEYGSQNARRDTRDCIRL
jgi:hypothetical protein